MGTYIYRISKHTAPVRLADGREVLANVAVFSYKPSWSSWDNTFNARMARDAAKRIPAGSPRKYFVCGSEDGTVDGESRVYENPHGRVNVADGALGQRAYPRAKGATLLPSEADKLTRSLLGSAWPTLDSLVDAWPANKYRPSFEVSVPELKKLADLYDARAKQRGFQVQAYRYGVR